MKKTLAQSGHTTSVSHKCSLILRLWRDGQSEQPDWRASVEIPETGRRIGFASLEQLFAFLIEFTEADCHVQPGEDLDDGYREK